MKDYLFFYRKNLKVHPVQAVLFALICAMVEYMTEFFATPAYLLGVALGWLLIVAPLNTIADVYSYRKFNSTRGRDNV